MRDLLITISGIFLLFLILFFLINIKKIFNFFLQFAILVLIGVSEAKILFYFWNYQEEYYPIQKTKFLPIKNIKGIFDSNNGLTNLDFRTSNGIFSIIKNDEYSKECLHNYYIKQSSECPITDIILEKEKIVHNGYFEQKISDNMYLYYSRESKLDGKLYKDISIYPVGSNSTNCGVNEFLIDNKCSKIIFESNFNFKNVSLIIELEVEKKSSPLNNFINYAYYCDNICALLIFLSLCYNCCTPKNNKKCNLYSIINLICYFCSFILLSIRYHKYRKIKQYLNNSKDIDKLFLPKYAFNLDTIIYSFSILLFVYFILYLIIPDKCHCCNCECKDIEDSKLKICLLIFPIIIIYNFIIIYEVINDYHYIRENYEIININWKQNSITSISISKSNNDIEYKTNNYTYYDIYTNNNDNSKICGKDSQDNNLYFPKDVDCPVNDIFISKYDLNEYEYDGYQKLKLSNENGYLYYTNKKTTGKIVTKITKTVFNLVEIYYKTNHETIIKMENDTKKTMKKKLNTIFYHEELVSYCKNKVSCSEEDTYKLYAVNYLGVNNNLISKIKDFKNNIDKYNNLCKFKYILYGLNFFDFIYFSYIFLVKDVNYGALGIGIVFLLPMIFYIIINVILFGFFY